MPRILLIDDEELVTRSIEKLLKRQGFDVVICSNGQAALDLVKNQDVDLLVSDMRMPGMNGAEVISKIREYLKSCGKKPVKEIIITGYAEEEANRQAEALNVADYIYKPFDLRDFLEAVKRNLSA